MYLVLALSGFNSRLLGKVKYRTGKIVFFPRKKMSQRWMCRVGFVFFKGNRYDIYLTLRSVFPSVLLIKQCHLLQINAIV